MMDSIAQATKHMVTAALIIVVVWTQGFVLFRVWDFMARRAPERESAMLTLIKNAVRRLIYDELAARRWLRSLMLFVGTSGVAFADQAAQLIDSPESARKIKIIGVVCAAIGGAITAGERNRQEDRAQGSLPPAEQSPQ